jgi:hypothetical protein
LVHEHPPRQELFEEIDRRERVGGHIRFSVMRSVGRPRRYVARYWLLLLKPALRYSTTRDAFVLRGIGNSRGPVLRPDRRKRQQRTFEGIDRRTRTAS